MSNKPLKKAVEIVQRLRHTDVARYPNSAAAEISDAVRPLRDAAARYGGNHSYENYCELLTEITKWEDIE